MKLLIASIATVFLACSSSLVAAETWINTLGSSDGVAIQGYDTVAFFTEKKAVAGKPELSHEWAGAKWLFATEENLTQFKQSPEKWAPQYGGHCALGVSDGYVSKKPTSGRFEVKGEKLYLFPSGTNSPSGAYDDWGRKGGPSRRIPEADKNWPQLKANLEAKGK